MNSPAWQGGWRQGLGYGLLALPLAFVALPLYVVLPNHYASVFGVPLSVLGALLLGARALDAVADPWIGRWIDAAFARSTRGVLGLAVLAALVLVAGFYALFFPAVEPRGSALLVWCAGALALTYLAYSVLSVLHQSWGARLGGDALQRARIVSWREGLALAGVMVASVLPSLAGLGPTTALFAIALAIGLSGLWQAPRPPKVPAADPQADETTQPSLTLPWRFPAFRRLLLVFLVNGTASAVPATLVLFFIRDRLQAPTYEPLFLASYFAAGALSMPGWVRLVERVGLGRAWIAGMGLAVAAFAWAAALGPGDVAAFALVCVASGVALGADLALPSALLAGVIQRSGLSGHAEGATFGWWNFATKLNLALAAGVALPSLQALGYEPGSREPEALHALVAAYCLLPCLLKLLAAGLLYTLCIRNGEDR